MVYSLVLLSILAVGGLSEIGVLLWVLRLKERGVLSWGQAVAAWLLSSALVWFLWDKAGEYVFR
jgi:RsiW-degrading membrane proteinase PrsW (M82 family)